MKENNENEEIKQNIIRQIIAREWEFFRSVHNTGGRASCQDNYEEFNIMRSSQWKIFSLPVLRSYLDDLILAGHRDRNPVMEKYAYMMKYSAPEEYEGIKEFLPAISEQKEEIAEKIIKIYFIHPRPTIKSYRLNLRLCFLNRGSVKLTTIPIKIPVTREAPSIIGR